MVIVFFSTGCSSVLAELNTAEAASVQSANWRARGYIFAASGYLQTLDDNHIVLNTGENGVPVYLHDLRRLIGPGNAPGRYRKLNGEETAGG